MKGKYFIEPLFHAVVEGRKTMMREIINPQPLGNFYNKFEFTKRNRVFQKYEFTCGASLIPKYRVGERLYLKEPYILLTDFPYCADAPVYKYDGNRECSFWKHTMPSKYARYYIEIISVKVERIRDISEQDAIAEGVDFIFTEDECKTTVGLIGTKPSDHGYRNYLWHGLVGNGITKKQSDNWDYQYSSYASAKDSYFSLMERINGSGAWVVNPFVWSYTFKLVKNEK